jgi:ABC-type multidrug transport system permease subunit
MARPGFSAQLDVLTDRELGILAGAGWQTVVLAAQAPLIGLLIGLAWRDESPNTITWLFMCLSVVWMGCMNACTLLVKERGIYLRERMVGLNLWAYLCAKLSVLVVAGAVQALLLLLAQSQLMHLPPELGRRVAIFVFLALTAATASALGLAISAYARSIHAAVVCVPLFMLPQVIFSEVVLESIDTGVAFWISAATLTRWSYNAVTSLSGGWVFWTLLGAVAALLAQLIVFMLITAFRVRLEDEA